MSSGLSSELSFSLASIAPPSALFVGTSSAFLIVYSVICVALVDDDLLGCCTKSPPVHGRRLVVNTHLFAVPNLPTSPSVTVSSIPS
ncbi:unnamed protein product [Rhizoctonia solani]|uniref:Uncharacterized protein n=1 Tax=Rhizoctonia solani TaxID=456999 RepID=A0A8H2W7K9_9AGAM|nr:unnamed protein product [Rhizoctonia solani]